MKSKGIFITLEGPDGCGKTTHAGKIAQYLRRKGFSVVRTREPGGTTVAEKIRNILLNTDNRMSYEAELLLYEASRADHVAKLIRPALNKGKIVICERFCDATLAYQGYGRGLNNKDIKNLNKYCTGSLKPDLTILLDVPVRVGLQRVMNTGTSGKPAGMDRLEQEHISFHRRVRKGYLKIAAQEPRRVKIISSGKSISMVYDEIVKSLDKVLQKRK